MTAYGSEDNTEADLLFYEDARRLGYMDRGRGGLGAYYADRGLLSANRRERICRREKTNTDTLMELVVDTPGLFPRAPRDVPTADDL